MKPVRRVFVSLALAVLVGAAPLLAARPGRTGAETENDPQRQVIQFDGGRQSERPAPDATAPDRPASRESSPRVTPFCEPVPETFFISSLGSIATDLGTAGYVIDKPGRYELTRNLAVPAVDIGILVRAHNVILDLNRHALSDPTGTSFLVRIGSAMNVTIQDGALDGGKAGVDAPASDDVARYSLTLRGLSISGDAAGYRAVAMDASHYRIENSIIRGGEISVGGFGGRVVGSRIRGSLSVGLEEGRFLHNQVEGTAAIGGYGSLIRGNSFRALSSLWALRTGGPGLVTDNEIDANGKPYGMVIEGPKIARNNLVRGGTYSTLVAGDSRSIVAGNLIDSDSIGIELSRSDNLIEENRIGGAGPWCGINFGSESSSNVYRRNLFSDTSQLVCGRENIDGGDNEIVAGDPIGRPGRRVNADPADRDTLFTRPGRACGPDEAVHLSEARPAEVGDDSVGLFIAAPGYYLVTQDLDLTPSDIGVLITGHDVTLDLGGHSIRAPALEGVRIVGGENVIIRNGEVSGGRLGLRIEGENGPAISRVRVQGVRLRGESTDYTSLRIHDLDYLELLDSHLSGVLSAGIVSGHTTGLIAGNWISVSFASAVELERFHDGVFRDNLILGRLRLGGGNTVTLNTFRHLHLHGSDNTLVNNAVTNSVEAVLGADRTLFAENVTLGAHIALYSSENRVLRNTIGFLTVGGHGTRIESNLIGNSDDCALKFLTDGDHAYADNVAKGPEGACGMVNKNEGGNYFSPSRCNNGLRAIDEVCDKQDTAGLDCADFGYQGGTLVCNQACDGFDTSGCVGF